MQLEEYMFPVLTLVYITILVTFSIQSNKKSGENKRIDILNKQKWL